jgi:transcriptional/translational regulatory protein YebC/TACO1
LPAHDAIGSADRAALVLELLDMLDDNDDVQSVYANFDIP